MDTTLQLKQGRERRVRGGHPWIYPEEVAGNLRAFTPGAILRVTDSEERFLGWAGFSRGGRVCARMLDRGEARPCSRDWFVGRLRAALMRRRHLQREAFRLVFSEADDLPGLLIDRYGSTIVVQCLTRTMEEQRPAIADALLELLDPEQLLFDGSSPLRLQEKLSTDLQLWWQDADDTGWQRESIRPEAGDVAPLQARFERLHMTPGFGLGDPVDFCQTENWGLAAACARGGAVLDLFCRQGGWGLSAALAGAAAVDFVDRGADTLACVTENAALNDLGNCRIATQHGLVLEVMKALHRERRLFQLVVCDPPPSSTSPRQFMAERKAMLGLNQLALSLVEPGGCLATCTRSAAFGSDSLRELLRRAARRAGRHIRILKTLEQASDHPRLPLVLETRILNGYLLQVD